MNNSKPCTWCKEIKSLDHFNEDRTECSHDGGLDQRLVFPVLLGEQPTRYYNWKSNFSGWTQREEEIAHAAYIAGWYHRCNQDPDKMMEKSPCQAPESS